MRRRRGGGLLPRERVHELDRAGAGGSLYLRARILVEGLYQGRHRTPHRGSSTEFYDYRAYAPGDPTSRIDWKLFGRTDRLYLRRFHQDAQLTVMIVVDGSASMDFAGLDAVVARPTKWRRAQELAAALAYLAARQGDRVGLVVGGSEDAESRAPGAGWGSLRMLIAALEGARCAGERSGGRGALAEAMDALGRTWAGRGLIVAIGDGLEDSDALLGACARCRAMGRAGVGREVALAQVLSRDELALPAGASGVFVDPETGAAVRSSAADVGPAHDALVHEHNERLRAGVVGMGGRYVLCDAEADPIDALRSLAW